MGFVTIDSDTYGSIVGVVSCKWKGRDFIWNAGGLISFVYSFVIFKTIIGTFLIGIYLNS